MPYRHLDSIQAVPTSLLLHQSASVRLRSLQVSAARPQQRSRGWLVILLLVILGNALTLYIIRSHNVYIVRSGSMAPAITTGSLVAVGGQQLRYDIGDVITYRSPSSQVITHRVIAVVSQQDGVAYRTQGDANNIADLQLVTGDVILGKVRGHVPGIGYLLLWLRTKTGFALIILFPATLVILHELRRVGQAWRELRKLPLPATAMLAAAVLGMPLTYALISDTVAINDSQFATASVFPTPTASPPPSVTPSASPTPSISPSPTPSASPMPTPTTSPCDTDITTELSNTNTGPGSTNENTVIIHQECSFEEQNEATIDNDIDIDANTGGNESSGNTNGGSVTSGDITVTISGASQAN